MDRPGVGAEVVEEVLLGEAIKEIPLWHFHPRRKLRRTRLHRLQLDERGLAGGRVLSAVSLDQVRANFATYGLLDDQVAFLKGWFRDTLPEAPVERLAVVRLDGDMYESTMDGFRNLYHKLSPGGYLIVDDYHAVPGCKAAVHDFIATLGPSERVEIKEIDGTGVFWQRTAG